MNLRNAMKQSCDIYFYEVARKLGIDRLSVTAKEFGLGKLMVDGFVEEKRGVVPNTNWKREKIGKSWYLGETLHSGIGQGYWQTTVGVELKEKILGIIGLGKVGSQVAKIGKAFGMEIMAWSENLDLNKCKELDVLPCSKDDLIKNSDFLSIHVQGGERYKNCITIKELDKMKKTAFLINTSRGPIVNEEDLIIALSTNEIAGAGLDVYQNEPDIPVTLKGLKNVVLLPHIGSATIEGRHAMGDKVIINIQTFLDGHTPPDRVVAAMVS